MNLTKAEQLELTKEEMKNYGYQVMDAIVEHFDTQNDKFPVATSSSKEMDTLFLEEAPEKSTDAREVLVASREVLLVTIILNKQVVLRMCLINPRTSMDDIKSTLKLCEQFAAE